jgi:hypothetical protein
MTEVKDGGCIALEIERAIERMEGWSSWVALTTR